MRKKSEPTQVLSLEIEDKSQRAVQSVEVGGRLLLALADSGSALSLKDLAARAEMTPSRAHPYLVSYGRLGLIEQDSSGRYDLGPAALRVGLASLQRLEPMTVAEPVIRQLAAQTGHAIAIAVWGNFGPTVVRLIEAQQPLHVSLRIGSVLSLFDTATGRAFASVLPQERLLQAIAGPLGEAMPQEKWQQRQPEIQEIVQEARRHGVSRAISNPIPGVNAFSAPVFDLEGNPVMVITMTNHENRLPAAWKNEAVSMLAEAVKELTLRLGGQQPAQA
ncbi:IclR family transcriptional regulator [Limnohabitans sp. MMS-10A-160]|jgi:DNA-binding IclR family transcriptional regulator|uniref:IclR family transcriptional regulator n=1 Tax=Limnohabitans sp. MMS-10A-160 TaxID=1835766 RepID=UPI000D3AD495|nr:IclR family transcriptional regulator [Limnohabitans sp. MMS-10A-160]PUE25091.1 IclR family transcriptional regulator [Limnohabitans sp. MMS-10A-160]